VGKPEGKKPLERPRRRCVDNIKMGLREVGWGNVDWIGLAQERNMWSALVNSVLNLRVP
jgi:predicted small integral membrane protein